jgi:hypothetical protein
MKGNPSKQAQESRDRIDRQDAYRKATALTRKIGTRQATAAELTQLEALRDKANGR